MKKNKLFISICVIVLVFIILGIVFFLYKEKADNRVIKVENGIADDTEFNEEDSSLNKQLVNEEKIDFDEEDLKNKIGFYLIYENFMQDYFVPNQEDINVNIVDYANEAKVLIGYNLVMHNNSNIGEKPTEEEVRKAVEEYCGEHYEKYIDTAEIWIAFDGQDSYDFVEVGDYEASGYCNQIEKIEKVDDEKYTVTFIYSRPSEEDYLNGNLDNIQKYKKQFTFIYHPDAKYTKYQLTEMSFMKGKEV